MCKQIPISVIMLTYNRENLVSGMIESIQNQTMRDYEFIIVDNGSSDRSGQIAEDYALVDSRIRVLHIEKSSIGRGRNVGLAEATGEYISFVDDDDICAPTYLETLYGLATRELVDIAICGTDRSHHDVSMVQEAEDALITLLDRKYYNVGFPTKLIRRTLFQGRPFDESSRYDDIYLMPTIIGASNQVAYHGLPLYMVNRHENNNSAWTTNHKLLSRDTLKEYLSVYRRRTEWLIATYPDNKDAWRYFEWSFMISMVNKITQYELEESYDIRDELCATLQSCKEQFLDNAKIQDFEINWMNQYILS